MLRLLRGHMQKTKQTSTKLLAIAITALAVIAAVTTISISSATPAFAKEKCTTTPQGVDACSGGEGFKLQGLDIAGGRGGHSK